MFVVLIFQVIFETIGIYFTVGGRIGMQFSFPDR